MHATWGRFLLAAQLNRSVLRGGATAEVSARAIDYLGGPQAAVPLTFTLEKLSYAYGYYNAPTVTSLGDTTGVTDAEGRAAGRLTLPADASGEFRVAVTAAAGDRTVRDHVWLWVLGQRDPSTGDEGDRYLELVADRKTYQPGDVARLVVRGESISGPILVTKEGQHVSWHRVMRPGPSRDERSGRSFDRCGVD